MSNGKEWPCGAPSSGGNTAGVGGGGGNTVPPVEEWSVHAQLTFTPQAGNIVLTTHDGSAQQHQHQHRCTADSGYSSERVMSPRSCASGNLGSVGTPLSGARATCSVTVAGHHTVTLTCAELPFDSSPISVPPPPPPPPPAFVPRISPQSHQLHQQQQHVCQHQHDIAKPPSGPPPGYQPQFHHHPPAPAHHISIHPNQRVQTPPAQASHIPAYRDAASQTSTTQVPQLVQSHLNKPKSRQLVKSPARVRTRSPAGANKSTASSSDGKKQPRTVHIDVYCTGSESTSSSSSEEETTSTPQTVFESSRTRIVHTRANSDTLPHALMKQKRRVLSNSTLDGSNLVSAGGTSSSTVSTSYPSPRSSLVSHRSLASASTLSSLRTSTTNHSSTATSWKDTDLESTRSLLQCDSFEYDNSFDKLRIQEKERQWANTGGKQRKSIRGNNDDDYEDGGDRDDGDDDDEDSSSSSTDDSEEGLAWSFIPKEEAAKQGNLRRESTVRRTSNTTDSLAKLPPTIKKSGSLSDSEASTSLRYKRDAISCRKMPYSPPSIFEHNIKAARFGPTVGSLRRPGHHVGPSKNPDCSCDTCKYYFEHVCYRNRTRSLGDRPMES